MQYQAILFDFDYTLGDSTIPIVIGYQTGLTAMGWPEPTVDQVRPTIGYTLYDGYAMLTGDTETRTVALLTEEEVTAADEELSSSESASESSSSEDGSSSAA